MDSNSCDNNAAASIERQEADDHTDQLHSDKDDRSENDIDMNLLAGHETSDNEIGGPSAENVEHETQHLVPHGTLQVADVGGSSLSVPAGVTKSISFSELNLKPEINPYPEHTAPGRQKMSRRNQVKLMNDLFVVSIAFMLLYSGFNGIQNIASSLFQDRALGVLSYSCYYACGITSCFLTPIILKKLTPKWSLVLSHMLTCLFLGSLLYPRAYTLIPSSLLLGITNGPLWAAAALYVSAAGFEYADQTGKTVAPVISRFHGIWISFQQCSQIFGNLLSSLVFQLGEMAKPDSYYGRVCGAAQCPLSGSSTNSNTSSSRIIVHTFALNMSNSQNSTLFEDTKSIYLDEFNSSYDERMPDTEHLNKIYILGGVYISLVVVAIILLIALLRVFRASSAVHDFGSTVSMLSVMSDQQSIGNLLLSSFRLLKKPKMLLLLPMSYLTGMHQGYLYADFTQAYISCTIGVSWVGYTMICYGITDVIFCYIGGKLNRFVGRIALYTGAFTVQSALVLTLILWSPSPDNLAPFFIIPALWGMCDAVWQPQTTALLSTLFPHHQEASFTNFRLLHCMGFAITFGYSQALCISIKFYIFQAIMTFAFICYIVLEMRVRKSKCLFTNESAAGKTIVINGINSNTANSI